MTDIKTHSVKFYQNLGKLFYAIAAADKHVHEDEFKKLKKIIKKEWLDIDAIEDENNKDTAYQIEIVFDWLNNKERLDADLYFNDFINYKKDHENLFTDAIKKLILKTAYAIAYSFSGKNKSELIMLSKLDMNFNI